MHENHRKRVRERYIKTGLEGFAEHNALELLLFYAIPRKDTNELAHKLIKQFGSLQGVLEAGYDKLVCVEGVGESTAVLLSMLPQLQRLCAEEKKKRPVLASAQSVAAYLNNLFFGVSEELFYVLCLDENDALINCCKVARGGANSVSVRKKQLLEAAFGCGASSVILAHNHPNGIAAPSREDAVITLELAELFSAVDIRMRDHCICTSSEVVSLASTERFKDAFN